MMWQIITNEWNALSRNRILLAISLCFFSVLLLSVFLGNQQTEKQMARYELAKDKLRKQWESIDAMNPHGAAHYGTYVFKPTNLLSSLDEGVNSMTGNVLRVEGHVQNEIVHSEASQMQSVSKFGKLKSSLLLQYVLPLLLLFLAFHSVSSEKQSGRLKLIVLQGARPSSLVWGKTLSIWLYGMVLLTLTILIYALFNWQSIGAEMVSRTSLFYLSYALYYFIIIGLTVLFSARWQSPTVALTSMLSIWILWTIFLPSILLSSVEKWHELPSRNAFQAGMKEDRSKGIDGHNPSDERAKELKQQTLQEYGVDSVSQLPINFDGLRMQADEEYGNQVWDKHFGHLREVFAQQKKSYQLAGIFNPFISLQNSSMGFSASDNLHHQEFLVQVEEYRRGFIKALNDKHAFGGSKTGDWGWEADNRFFKSVPDYHHQPVALAAVFPNYQLDLLLLVAWTVLVGLFLGFGTKKLQIL
ncbi:MAG: DUF3526 domain-containing protein [Bacteroidota bacterium]